MFNRIGLSLRNGAVLLKMHIVDEKERGSYKTVRSVVMCVKDGYEPYITWEMEQDINALGERINEMCVWGHYFKELEAALGDFDVRVNKEQNLINIRVRGYGDGTAAATWIVDGNTEDPAGTLRKLLDGVEEGDPEIMDALPAPRLSGEFADDPSWYDILRDECEGESAEFIIEHDLDGDLYDAYEDKFHEAVIEQIRSMHKSYAG